VKISFSFITEIHLPYMCFHCFVVIRLNVGGEILQGFLYKYVALYY